MAATKIDEMDGEWATVGITSVRKSLISGCLEFRSKVFADRRGVFVKTCSDAMFSALGVDVNFSEIFYTISEARVLRGMHFQLPPADHSKLVYCISGSIMDVGLDLRRDSPTYGQHEVVNLSAETKNSYFLPRGIAHGFYVLQAPAVVMYHVTSEHVPALDAGIAWDSFGVPWPDLNPILSQRDKGFQRLAEFDSPFG
jgi:dTDP-4-dehydrorhamnose 3,5-epimerase